MARKGLSFVVLALFGVSAVAFLFVGSEKLAGVSAQTQTIPNVIVLGKDAKLSQITFNHVKHNGGTYRIDGTGPIACIECHHAAQPASELAKHPPLKTAWQRLLRSSVHK